MIDDPGVALAVLDPVRARVLAALVEPGSATTVASVIGESRQKVNYHLRALQDHGLVHLVEERPRRGLTERVMVASARSYVMSSAVLGDSAADPGQTDGLSAQFLLALAARIISEVGELARRARSAEQTLATLAIDTEIRFASATERAAFTEDLSTAITSLVGRYHDEAAPGGRRHRLVVAAHPRLATARTSTKKA